MEVNAKVNEMLQLIFGKDYEALEDKISKLETDNTDLKSNYTTLESNYTTLESENAALQQANDRMRELLCARMGADALNAALADLQPA